VTQASVEAVEAHPCLFNESGLTNQATGAERTARKRRRRGVRVEREVRPADHGTRSENQTTKNPVESNTMTPVRTNAVIDPPRNSTASGNTISETRSQSGTTANHAQEAHLRSGVTSESRAAAPEPKIAAITKTIPTATTVHRLI